MKKSPIKLRSSSKAKLRATHSPSNTNEQSQVLCDDSKVLSSLHTIPVKQSPNCHRVMKSNFTTENVNYAKIQHYNNVLLRSGSPTGRYLPYRTLEQSKQMSGSKSFHMMTATHPSPVKQVLVSPQKSILFDSVVKQESVVHLMSPTKSGFNNERSFVRVEVTKKPVGGITTTVRPIMVGPQQVQCQVSAREADLERKVRVLEMRIRELYAEKSQVETQMNETNIRLQYENNLLREKLNSLTQKQQQSSSKYVSFEKNTSIVNQQTVQVAGGEKPSALSQQASQKLIKQLERSEENEYHQSKEIHNLRQQLLQTEEMLSKQINKSLSLLEELTFKENENENLKDDFKALREKLEKAENHFKQQTSQQEIISTLNMRVQQLQVQLQSIQDQNHELMEQLQTLRKNGTQMNITKELMTELQQNNQLLINAIRNLESSLKQNEKQLQTLQQEKSSLQQSLSWMEQQLEKRSNLFHQKDFNYEKQIEELASKLVDIQTDLIEKNSQIETLTLTLHARQTLLQNKDVQIQQKCTLIRSQDEKIQILVKSQEQEGNSSTANSFYNKKPSNDPCNKCEQLRKTIIKLNTHLNRSNSFAQIPNKTC